MQKRDSKFASYAQSCGILPKWHNAKWSDYTNDDKALKFIKSYVDKSAEFFAEGLGVYLHGSNGVGKTMLTMMAFMALIDRGYSVKVLTLSTLIDKSASAWFSKEEARSVARMLQRVDFLCIEEIGKEFQSTKNNLGPAILDRVIRYRVQMKKPIWFTANVPPEKVKDMYTEDIASMLREGCYILNVTGGDYRKKIASKIEKRFDV